jgi:hypothetical protein
VLLCCGGSEEEGSGSAAGSSVSAEAFAAAAARGALYRHGSDAGSPPPLGVPCEGALQDTPDYIRRSAARHRGVAPLELFSAAASSPRPGGGGCAAAEAAVTVAAAAEGHTAVGGGPVVRAIPQPKEEEVGCTSAALQHISSGKNRTLLCLRLNEASSLVCHSQVESGSCSQLRQQYACCGHASIWLGSSVILFEHDFSCPVMLLGVYPFYVRFAWFILLI